MSLFSKMASGPTQTPPQSPRKPQPSSSVARSSFTAPSPMGSQTLKKINNTNNVENDSRESFSAVDINDEEAQHIKESLLDRIGDFFPYEGDINDDEAIEEITQAAFKMVNLENIKEDTCPFLDTIIEGKEESDTEEIKEIVEPIIYSIAETRRRVNTAKRTRKKPNFFSPSPPPIKIQTKKRAHSSSGSIKTDISQLTKFSDKSILNAVLSSLKFRCENSNADTQAKRIHGTTFDTIKKNGDACCALCGFRFKDRQPHIRAGGQDLAMSYDHFIPVSFEATILRTVISGGTYSTKELEIMSHLGEMVCFHCNYLKSQQKWLSCPRGSTDKNFSSLKVNTSIIQKQFLDKLPEWRHVTADGRDTSDTTSFKRCLKASNKSEDEWKKERLQAIVKKANLVCKLIKDNVDFEKAIKRVRLARSIFKHFNGDAKDAKKAVLLALTTFPSPWKDDTLSEGSHKEGKDYNFDINCPSSAAKKARRKGGKTQKRKTKKRKTQQTKTARGKTQKR